MGDDRLAARAAKGDRHAFAELYRRHHQRLYRYSLSLVGQPDDAADALQTTMAKALSALERGEAVRGVRPWLFRIAHNASIDLVRSRRPRALLDELDELDSSPLTAPSAASEAQSRAELAEVVADIRELPDRQASALVMRELSELSYAEIAGALDTSPLAARQLVHQARSLLHDNRNGRAMDCDTVRKGLGDTDGKRPRDRRMRAHLAACAGCADFGRSIRGRRSALAALAPPLAPAAASDILARLLGSTSGSGAGVAAGGAGAGAGAAKLAGASGIAKLAGAAAAGTAAVAAMGGAVMAGGALLAPDDAGSPLRPDAVEALLRPDLPALRLMPEPLARAEGDRSAAASEEGRSESGSRETGSASPSPGADGPPSPTGPSGGGLPLGVVAEETDPPVELGAVGVAAGAGRDLTSEAGSAAKVPETAVDIPEVPIVAPDRSPASGGDEVELPDGPGGSRVEVPDVETPDIDVPDGSMPDVEVPDGSMPDIDVPDGSMPDLEVPESSAEVPGPDLGELSESSALSGSGSAEPQSSPVPESGTGPSVPGL